MSAKQNPLHTPSPGLAGIKHILAVSSCKGGVGKSTIACNLTYTLASLGLKVGLFDADLYGPSLPTLVHVDNAQLMQVDGMIQPLAVDGVKLMSMGYIPREPDQQAAIMRGPMATQVIKQLLTGTEWGDLDYLVIDMPPGTGDIVLSLTQLASITAALIVTTPQQLSFIDVVKGIQMFDKVDVPTIGVIENMSWFQPEPEGKKYFLFGQGARRKLAEQYGYEHTFELPVQPRLAELSDRGQPAVLAEPTGDLAAAFREIAERVVIEVQKLGEAAGAKPKLTFEEGRGFVYQQPSGNVYEIAPVDLRMACRGAHSVDEFTGEPLIKREDIPADIHATSVGTMGNYAVTVQWSHGHPMSIYPYPALDALVEGQTPVVNANARFEV